MASKQSLSIDQRISMRLSALQLRFVRLLEFNAPEIEEAVERELEDNPALSVEEDSTPEPRETPSYMLKAKNYSPDDFADYDFSPADTAESLYDSLLRQLSEKELPKNVVKAAHYIIGSLDPNGYLRRPLPNLVNDMDFGAELHVSLEEAEEALRAITEMEPYGIGARDLQECLRIQLTHLPKSQQRDDALRIINEQFEAFSMKHTGRIKSGLKIDDVRVRDAISLITTLNPKPGASVGPEADPSNIIIPDITINDEYGVLTISTGNNIPELAIDRSFSEAVAEMEADAKKEENPEAEFVMTRYNDARDFINILKQRQETLIKVMTSIMKIQEEYFKTQDVYKLKPMMLKDISAMTGLDLSVVSRATNNKYVSTPWGIFPLRFFFSDSIGNAADEEDSEGEDSRGDAADLLTNRKVEAEIKAIVEGESKLKPFSDEKIRREMEARGFDVSRRTVAKYRLRLGIPVARLRKDL